MKKLLLSEELQMLHDCGDAGRMVEGLAEQARILEEKFANNEHLQNIRRLLDRLDSGLTVGDDSQSWIFDIMAHMRNELELASE